MFQPRPDWSRSGGAPLISIVDRSLMNWDCDYAIPTTSRSESISMHYRLIILSLLSVAALAAEVAGAEISYRLPTDGPLPRTWRVTLAITDPKNPDWIISQFAAGVARTVTAENGGRFTETWNGLDDNFMPVPPGEYGVKGICMPAEKWHVDGEYHSITPEFVGGINDWLPPRDQAHKLGEPFVGDPVNSPIGDIAVSPEGIAVFYYQYLENGLNNPMIDLRKPQGPGQFLRAFPSGGAGGGTSTCTDGETVWSWSQDGGYQVYRADGKAFGSSPRALRKNGYAPEGMVTSMAAWKSPTRTTVFIAQRGKLVQKGDYHWVESEDPLDVVTVHAGDGGEILRTIPLSGPRALTARNGLLYGLHTTANGFAVSTLALSPEGLPVGSAWKQVLAVPAALNPGDLAVDSKGRIYISEPTANKVHQYAADGKRLRSYGKLARQRAGSYDRETLMYPQKLASWTDADGQDRLLIMERHGPCRVSEWGADGTLIREFPSLQTRANDGWTVDPANPAHMYIWGFGGWLSRYVIDYDSGRISIAAVWPDIGTDPFLPGISHMRMVRIDGRAYLACAPRGQLAIYRLDGQQWKLSAGIVRIGEENKPAQHFTWRDVNGDGKVQEDEFRSTPMTLPGNVLRYHGEQIGEDLALLAITLDGRDLWRLPVAGYDPRGIPELGTWEKVVTDPVFTARAEGTATALFGGNELADRFSSDWAQFDGTPERGYWVTARGGPNATANSGSQEKVSAYVPDGKGGMRLRWRVGRAAISGTPRPGETLAAMHIRAPMNGILSVIDQTRCGIILYNENGLYVDTLFPPSGSRLGLYELPGEFFAGMLYPDLKTGAIYVGVGKSTPLIFRCRGWSLKENPVQKLPQLQSTVNITLAQIATPPEIALSVRGGAGSAKLARFAPAFGGVEHDGTLRGWEQADPVVFNADEKRKVEVRCLYDPEHLHIRIHARTGSAFQPRPLHPIERVFSHDRATDAVSFYIQGDLEAKPNGPPGGRPGDVRLVMGIFDDNGTVRPAAVGFHVDWKGSGAQPQAYQTPVGQAKFAHVGLLEAATLHGHVDADGQGYVVSASIPRRAIPGLPPLSSAVKTAVNFEATFGGHAKFWWSNTDGTASRETYDEPSEARLYPGSWAPAEFAEPDGGGLILRNWLACGPFGGPEAAAFVADPPDKMKSVVRAFYQQAVYPPDESPFTLDAVYTGPQVTGFWPDPGQVQWQPVEVAKLDARVHLGKGGAQVWYAATWIHADTAMPVQLVIHSMPQAQVRMSLNDVTVFDDMATTETGRGPWLTTTVSTNLAPGWNRLQARTYCWGYGSVKVGASIIAPLDKLWGLRSSGRPPQD